jgi:photosystem II stability/assembly factor-like uncharacterized protein
MKNFTFLTIFTLITAFSSAQAVFNWQSSIIGTDNNLQKMTITGNEAVIAGFGNNFLKSTDGGGTWNKVNFFNPAFSFYDISIKGNIGYMVSYREAIYNATPNVYVNGVILKTNDGGNSWASLDLKGIGSGNNPALNPNDTLSYGMDFQSVGTVNDSVVYCALRWFEYNSAGAISHSGVFKSTSGGATWKNVSGDLGSNVVTTIVFNGTNGLIGGNKMLYKTNPSLDSLSSIFSNMNTGGSGYIADITLINDNEFYLVTTADSIFFTKNGGSTFGKLKISGGIKSGWDIYKVNDSTLVLGGNSSKNVVTTDGGITWKNLGIATAIWEIPGIMNDSLLLLAKSAIYKVAVSELVSSSTFHPVVQNVGNDNLQKAAIIDANTAIVVGNKASFAKTTNKGLTWTNIDIPAIPALTSVLSGIEYNDMSQKGNETYLATNRFLLADYPTTSPKNDIYWSGGLFSSTDNWVTYKIIDLSKVGAADATDPAKNPYHASCNGANTSYLENLGNNRILLWVRWYDYSAATRVEHSRVFRSTDGGKNWAVVTDDYGTKYVQSMESSATGDTVYVGGNTFLLKSMDGGASFNSIYANLDAGEDDAMFINSIRVYGNQIFIATSADGNWMSNDGGSTFAKMSTASGANDFYKLTNSAFIFLGTTGKSMFTNDGGTNWTACHPGVSIWEVGGVYNGKLYALAGKGTIYTVNISDLALSTPEIRMPESAGLDVLYKSDAVELVTVKNTIERCRVYTVAGQLLFEIKPTSNKCEFKNGSFLPGIYIISSLVEGKVYSNKVYLK